MKRLITAITGILMLFFVLSACSPPPESDAEQDMGYDYYAIEMNTDFALSTGLENGEGKPARVVLLIGRAMPRAHR